MFNPDLMKMTPEMRALTHAMVKDIHEILKRATDTAEGRGMRLTVMVTGYWAQAKNYGMSEEEALRIAGNVIFGTDVQGARS